MELRLVHPGAPVPKGRPRTGHGVTYTPKRTVEAEESLGWTMRGSRPAGWALVEFYAIECRFFMPTFARIDFDNLLKLVMDAGNTILWNDDTQVVEAHSYVVRGDPRPRTELKVRTVESPHFAKR